MRLDDIGPYSLDALAGMARPDLFTTDAAAWRTRLVGWFEEETGRSLYPAQVETLLIEALAYAMSMLGEEAQATAKQHLVAFADLAGLERLGANRSTPRLPAAVAQTELRFSLAAARTSTVVIPHGTRVGASGGAVFKTTMSATIPASQLTVLVSAEAEEAGLNANGYLPGQITALLEPVAGLSVTNTIASEGGSDKESLGAYRLRVANAFERISTGGSQAWYKETALAISAAVIDVAVVRPQPCYVDLYPLTATGAAGLALRNQVLAGFNTAETLDIRFGDLVTVKPPIAVVASPMIAVRVRGALPTIVADANAAATNVLNLWRTRLGSIVAPSEIEAAIRNLTGVIDAEVSGLAFQQLAQNEFLAANAPVINVTVMP